VAAVLAALVTQQPVLGHAALPLVRAAAGDLPGHLGIAALAAVAAAGACMRAARAAIVMLGAVDWLRRGGRAVAALRRRQSRPLAT
jgi:hypothetical protein